MFDKIKLLINNQVLMAEVARLEKSEAELIHDGRQYMAISADLATENEELRDLLREAKSTLDFFKNWGESLNAVIGYSPAAASWGPMLEVMGKIDAKLAEK